MSNERKIQPDIRNNSGNNTISLTGRGTTKINKSFFNDTAGKIVKGIEPRQDSNKKN